VVPSSRRVRPLHPPLPHRFQPGAFEHEHEHDSNPRGIPRRPWRKVGGILAGGQCGRRAGAGAPPPGAPVGGPFRVMPRTGVSCRRSSERRGEAANASWCPPELGRPGSAPGLRVRCYSNHYPFTSQSCAPSVQRAAAVRAAAG
jgi:hypothetical protein